MPVNSRTPTSRCKEPLVIEPYWDDDQQSWSFDDRGEGILREAFVGAATGMIDRLVHDLPDAKNGFRLTIAPSPFDGYQAHLVRIEDEIGGCRFASEDPQMTTWFSRALLRYFGEPPLDLYVRVGPRGSAVMALAPDA
jgi:hypothetical protein